MKQVPALVSIVIPCYNHAQFVQETIQSVIEQDYENIELIIIDDGSKDNAVDVIKKMIPACEARFKRFEFRYRPNKGLCATLNEALVWCEGEFFAPLASDDIVKTYKTSVQVEYLMNNPKSVGVFGGVEQLSKGDIRVRAGGRAKYSFEDIFLHKHSLRAPTQLLRLLAVKNVSGYRQDLIIEDWSMWLFLTENGGTLDNIDKSLAVYRRHEDNLSGKHELMKEGRTQILDLYHSNKLYKPAKSRALLIHAHGIQVVSKLDAFKIGLEAIKASPSSFYSKSFVWLLVKMFR